MIVVPPLRERTEDIDPLVTHFVRLHGSGRSGLEVAPAALERLLAHRWPGNVSELKAALERACRRAPGRSIEVEHRSHPQLVDLRVQLIDRAGNLWSLRPWGQFEREPQILSRTRILLQDAGQRRVSLVRAQLPSDINAVELRAVLRNPGATGDSIFSFASREAIVAIPR